MDTVVTLDIEEQIEVAEKSLERINGWINSCDSKAGTAFALVGVLMTIIFTNDGLTALYGLVKQVVPPTSFCTLLYIVFFIVACTDLTYGVAHLIFVMIAKIDTKIYSETGLKTNSLLFFGSISKRGSYQEFQKEVIGQGKEEYLNDLLSQIYINSKIANEKHKNYNKGMKWTIIGFIAFITVFVIGLYLY